MEDGEGVVGGRSEMKYQGSTRKVDFRCVCSTHICTRSPRHHFQLDVLLLVLRREVPTASAIVTEED